MPKRRESIYAIGRPDGNGGYGMLDGPCAREGELRQTYAEPGDCLLHITGAGQTTVLARWIKDAGWVNEAAVMQNISDLGSAGSSSPPLRVFVRASSQAKDSKLVIEIGVETLAWASRPENGGPLTECRVSDARQHEWADDVARAMMREDELGSTPLTEFLDKMYRHAANHGSEALDWNKD